MTTAAIPPPSDRFHNNVLCMKEPILKAISQCKGASPSLISAELVEGAFGLLVFMDHQELLNSFIERTHQHWEIIAKSKDVAPIIDSVLGGFQELGAERIAEVKRVVKDRQVDIAIQQQLLDLGRSLVKIAIKYLHGVQHPGGHTIDVEAMAKLYALKLAAL